jgi:5-formyltetrahydrofolate cyclo-ligase
VINSIGLGELVVIGIVILLFIDPSKVGPAARGLATLKRKWTALQREVKDQFDALALEETLRKSAGAVRVAKAALRREALDAVRALPSSERAAASGRLLERLTEWPSWRNAKTVALFCGTRDEVDTEGVIRAALAEGKTVLLPRTEEEHAGKPRLVFLPVGDYDRDLVEGAFGILEPREEAPAEPPPEPDLILVPGTAFDERGGRVGRGKGFYDRWLEGRAATRAGLCFDAQILRKKLPLEAHDQLLDAVVTERRLLNFSRPAEA